MINSNEATSKYYNQLYSALRPKELTESEVSLINFITKPNSKILDVGGGTGRHAKILAQLGFKVTLVDSSHGMLRELNNGNHNIYVINKNIYTFKTKQKYDLIILMWNTFNEIAVTKKDAIRLLKILSKLLKTNGKILINIDDSKKVNPSEFNFKTMQSFNNNSLEGEWKTFKYNKRTNTSISKETISFFKNGILKDTQTSYIKQRYWSLDEINKLAKLNRLDCITKKIDGVEELYLILSKQDYN